jgi:carbon monoxide dehydrogenase subunit G
MHMSGEQRISAPREAVWAALNDTNVLRRSLPGCEAIERIGDNDLVADITAVVGPVKAKFKGKIQLSEIDPPNGCRISGEGHGGSAGFANGAAIVALVSDADGTVVKYDVEATVGGKLARIGSRLVDAAARKTADDFFAEFSRIVAPDLLSDAAPDLAPAMAPSAAAHQGVSPLVWVPTLIVMVAFLTLLFA